MIDLLAAKDRLILSLSEKLLIVAEHLGRLSERREVRNKMASKEADPHPWGCECPECAAPAVPEVGLCCSICKSVDCICRPCAACGGDGKLYGWVSDPHNPTSGKWACPECSGRGKVGPCVGKVAPTEAKEADPR